MFKLMHYPLHLSKTRPLAVCWPIQFGLEGLKCLAVNKKEDSVDVVHTPKNAPGKSGKRGR